MIFQFINADGSSVTSSFSFQPVIYPLANGSYRVLADVITSSVAPAQINLFTNVYKVENNGESSNDWYINQSGSVISGSTSSGSLVNVTFNLENSNGISNLPIYFSLTPINKNIGFIDVSGSNFLVTGNRIECVTDLTGSLTIPLVPNQPYKIKYVGNIKNCIDRILPTTDSNVNDCIVQSSMVSQTITPQNQAVYGYTAQTSDLRYLGINANVASSSYAVSSSYSLFAMSASYSIGYVPPTSSISASWASSSLSSSYALSSSAADSITFIPDLSNTASYSLTASYAENGGGSSYPDITDNISNHTVGINNTTPSYSLDVSGTFSSTFYAAGATSKKVTATLTRDGSNRPALNIQDSSGYGQGFIDFYTYSDGGVLPDSQYIPTVRWGGYDDGGFSGHQSFWCNPGGGGEQPMVDVFDIYSNRVVSNVNIGIGTNSPYYPLDVNGSVNFTGNLLHNGLPYTASLASTITAANNTVLSYLSGSRSNIQSQLDQLNGNAGLTSSPTITNNNNGTITVSTASVNLYDNPYGTGVIASYQLAQTTLALDPTQINIVVATLSGGNAVYQMIYNQNNVDDISIIPVSGIEVTGVDGAGWHYLEFDFGATGLALPNKLALKDVSLNGHQRQNGLLLYVTGSATDFAISAGSTWYSVYNEPSALFDSYNYPACITSYLIQSASIWSSSYSVGYINCYYNGTSGLTPLAPNSCSVNYIYKTLATNINAAMVVVSSQQYNNILSAEADQPPVIPTNISEFSLLTGRIIVQSGSLSPTVQSAYTTQFGSATITNHNDLLGIQGGMGAQYYHLTQAEYLGNGTGVFVRQTGTVASSSYVTSSNIIGTVTSASYSLTSSAANSITFIPNLSNTSSYVSASNNIIVGGYIVNSGSSPAYSNFIGSSAGTSATNAANSNFLGNSAGANATNAYNSNFFGNYAGNTATNAYYSNFLGYQAGYTATSASNSNFFGYQAGYNDTVNNSGSKSSILIGDYTSTKGFSDSIAIGKGTANSVNNQFNIGNVLFGNNIYSGSTSTSSAQLNGKVGINKNNPVNALDVVGNISCSVITASLLIGTSSYSVSSSAANSITFVPNLSNTASYTNREIAGIIPNTSFGGTPLTSSVTGLGLSNTNYAIGITGVDAKSWTYYNKTTGGFTISSNSATAMTGEVSWTVIKL